jgi:hypothetical protein
LSRDFLPSATLAAAMVAIALASPVPAQTGDSREDLRAPVASEGPFATPRMADRPMYRFWNNGGMMTQASITEQVAQIKAAGAGGFEANQLSGAPTVSKVPGYDPVKHGFGTSEWTRAWTQLFKAGKAAGLRVDHLYTPGWSAGIPDLSPDEPGSAKEIAFGSVFLDAGATYEGPVPATKLPSGVVKRVLQGVVAYRCETNCTGAAKPVAVLDPATAFDLLATVIDGRIRYTAPAGTGRYVIVGSWMQGTGQSIVLAHTPTPSYMVDHFGALGARAIIDFWERKVLTSELREALKASGGSLFFDSLELNRYGVEVRHWTDNFLTEFRNRRGYSLVPYLAAVSTSSEPLFSFSNGVGERIREDYRQTLSDLFVENHIKPLKQWAHSYGMTLRGQAYAEWGPGSINNADAAIALDIPEQEANNRSDPLFSTDGSDTWRQVVSANAQVGRNIVSSETGTFGRTDGLARISLVARINELVGLGMNKVIFHGWADQSPGAAEAWPGYYPFRDRAAENYGVQNPTFSDDVTINDYVARLQAVVRRGQLRNDVALYWGGVGAARYGDLGLERSGYTYGFMNDALIADASAKITAGRLTALRYRAFVLDGEGPGIPMALATARQILSWARSGFPIVVAGDLPQRVSGYHPAEDAALRNVVSELLAEKSVARVPNRAAVPGALKAAGVDSMASYDAKPLVTMHRESADSDYYYLFNAGQDRTAASVTLQGRGLPYRYDAWTGIVRPIARYTRTTKGVSLDIDLATGDSALIALTNGNRDVARMACSVAVTSTSADEVRSGSGSALWLRDSRAGRYVTTLTNGKNVTSSISSVGPRTTFSSWTLQVTSWQAGAGPNDIAKIPLAPVTLTTAADGKLPSWQEIAGLEQKSGTSTYTTTFDIGHAWTGGTGAYLDLGSYLGTAQVSLNGRRLPAINLVDASKVDLGGFLRPGRNTLQVHLATPIYNAAYKTKSPYGLIGPVTIVPYGQVTLPTGCGSARYMKGPSGRNGIPS